MGNFIRNCIEYDSELLMDFYLLNEIQLLLVRQPDVLLKSHGHVSFVYLLSLK